MFSKKLNRKDLEELKNREKLVKQHSLISSALEMQKLIWLKTILPKYNLDPNKNYSFDLKTGKIKCQKQLQ